MKPYDRVTILRNRHRARDLRIFRARVQGYFEQLAYETENQPADWESLRAARAEINRMLPRVIQIVQAADLGGWAPPHPAGTPPAAPWRSSRTSSARSTPRAPTRKSWT